VVKGRKRERGRLPRSEDKRFHVLELP
jgi:hypothetical protein